MSGKIFGTGRSASESIEIFGVNFFWEHHITSNQRSCWLSFIDRKAAYPTRHSILLLLVLACDTTP